MSASAGPSVGSHRPTGLKFQRANYYLWEEPERGVRIYLSLAIVDRLQLEVLRGIDGFPADQAEVGGILIGRTESDGERTITLIEDFAPVPCGYRAGPFYRLTEKDAVKFEGVLARCSSDPRGLSVVGYYRSHNRDDLCLSPDDLNLIHRYFSEPDKVFLLVKTLPSKACTAGFFFWEDGHIQSEFTYLEVPFGPVKSYSITEPARSKDRLTPVAKDLGKDLTAQSRGLSESARKSRRVWVVRGLAVIAAAVVVTLAGFNYLRSKQSPPHEPPSASLRLHVVRQAGSLALTWNPASQDLIGAEKAILYINEGSNQKAVHLDPIELRRGEVSFAPSGDDVELRFEIDRDGRPSAAERIHLLLPNIAVGDTVREKVVNSTNSQGAPDLKTRTIEARANSSRRELPPATSAKKEQGAQMARLNSSVSSPQPFRFVAPARAFKTSNNALATSDIQIEQPPSIPIETQISELIVSAPIVRPEAPPPSNNPTQSAIERRPLAQSETSLASVTPPVTGKAGPSQPPPVTTFVGPHVIRQVNPSIPVDLRYKITPDIEIEVAVTIDEYGKVTDAKLASTKGVGARFFSAEVLRAARLFLFRPAQDNNRSVRSSMLLTFRFSGGPPK
jgi:hypothetical protein